MTAPEREDKSAGFIGLVVAIIFLLGMATTIVKLTNAKYAHGGESGAAQESAH
jgi:hypothetical protein